jgi:hypothetical protein
MFEIDITSSKIICLLAAILFIYTIFWITQALKNSYYSKTVKTALLILRSVAIIIFILLSLDVKITYVQNKIQEPNIAFVWDFSESMATVENYSAQQVISSQLYKNIHKNSKIDHIAGMNEAEVLPLIQIQKKAFNEGITDIASLLRFSEKQLLYDEIILVTDGQSYLGERLDHFRLQHEIKLHCIAVGEVAENVFPEIRSITFPEHIFKGDSVNFSWTLQNPSDKAIQGELIIEVDGKETFKQSVDIPPYRMKNFSSLTKPLPQGNREWVWTFRSEEKQKSLASKQILVKDSKLNIVIHADPPNQDISMIKHILSKDDKLEIVDLPSWQERFPGQEPYVVIQTWDPNTHPKLFKDVPSILLYRNNQSDYRTTNKLTIEKMRTYVYVDEDPVKNRRYWEQVPPVQIAAFQDIEDASCIVKDEGGRALILEKGRDIIMLASGMWQWNLAAYQKDWDGLYEHVIRGMVEELVGIRSGRMIAFDQVHYNGFAFQTIGFNVEIADDLFVGSELKISLLDSTYSEIKRIESASSKESFYFKVEEPGDYFMRAGLIIKGEELASDTVALNIRENDLERSRLGVNGSDLQKLCANNAGMYIPYNALDTTNFQIETQHKYKMYSHEIYVRKKYYLYLMMFLAVLSDWVLRKMNGGI